MPTLCASSELSNDWDLINVHANKTEVSYANSQPVKLWNLSGSGKTEKGMIIETLGVNHKALLNVMFGNSFFLLAELLKASPTKGFHF